MWLRVVWIQQLKFGSVVKCFFFFLSYLFVYALLAIGLIIFFCERTKKNKQRTLFFWLISRAAAFVCWFYLCVRTVCLDSCSMVSFSSSSSLKIQYRSLKTKEKWDSISPCVIARYMFDQFQSLRLHENQVFPIYREQYAHNLPYDILN